MDDWMDESSRGGMMVEYMDTRVDEWMHEWREGQRMAEWMEG